MLGRFLEISLHTPDIQESLRFYERLGFAQATVGDTWTHPYAVVTDGRLFLGLHGRECPPIAVSYVLPNLAVEVAKIRKLGVEIEEHFERESFHQATFADPHGFRIILLEARTFSPPALAAGLQS